jgi:hypothetical protein
MPNQANCIEYQYTLYSGHICIRTSRGADGIPLASGGLSAHEGVPMIRATGSRAPLFLLSRQRNTRVVIERKGRACNFTLEAECLEILRAMVPNKKAVGKFLSDLIRAEEYRRYEARRLRERLVAVAEDVGAT